jgi:hypothetical protein
MNIYLNEKLILDNIIFQRPIENKLESYKNFYKILYTHPRYTMNYILFPLHITNYNIEFFNGKYKLNVYKNDPIFQQIFDIEKTILTNLNRIVKKKISLHCVFDLRNKKHMFIFHQPPDLRYLSLKISGVWENESSIGIIYKLFYCPSS